MYIINNIYCSLGISEKGQKTCESLDTISEQAFKEIIVSKIYNNIYEIKFNLLCKIHKQTFNKPKYNYSDFADSNNLAIVCMCNSLLSFVECFKK